ncbi:hypothetical protein BJX70DRAFT_148362 [Aspergillus crustosus]
MLRCRNATASQMQFATRIALRAPRNSPWTRVSHDLSPPSNGAMKARLSGIGQVFAVPRRCFSSRQSPFDELKAAAANEEVLLPDRSSRPIHKPKMSPRDDPVMQAAMGRTSISPQVIKKELRWLGDRVILAERIQRLLREDDIAMAAELVRAAQHARIDCIAGWNHILGYCLDLKNPKAAFRFWNDMKKRGRMPDERSYTIMFEGLSRARKNDSINPVSTAITIYKSIFNAQTSSKPNIIHTNVLLKVCWQHEDMEALWKVASELPEDGPGSPNSTTYSIILNAICDSVERYAATLQKHESMTARNKQLSGVAEGKRIWADVVYRWKRGQLALDNKLVSAMARVLWTGGSERHSYEVFQLYHQTAGIPILADEPSHDRMELSRRAEASPLFRLGTEEDPVPFVDSQGSPLDASDAVPEHLKKLEEEEEQENFDKLFDPVVSPDAEPYSDLEKPQPTKPHYIPIGNRELSVIMENCLQMTNAVQVGKAYWNHLTQEDHGYRFPLDAPSFASYLRILRLGRSSRMTVDLLRDQMIPTGNISSVTFHIAMTTCSRDRKNPNVLNHANEILGLMDKHLLLPNHKAISGYLFLIRVLEENPFHLDMLNGIDASRILPTDRLDTKGRKLLLELRKTAVQALRPHVAKFEEAFTDADLPLDFDHLSQDARDIVHKQAAPGDFLVKLMTQVRYLIDAILIPANERLLTKEERKQYLEESINLRKYSRPDHAFLFQDKKIYPSAVQQEVFFNGTSFDNKTSFNNETPSNKDAAQKQTNQEGSSFRGQILEGRTMFM